MLKFKTLIIIAVFLAIVPVFAVCRYVYVQKSYPDILSGIEQKKRVFAQKYTSSKTHQEKQRLLKDAREYLIQVMIDELLNAWIGTPWSFNGDTRAPLKGSIACGSFVENTLRDAGFNIDNRMSAQPSENVIISLCKNTDIKRFSNTSIKGFIQTMTEEKDGLYMVGLDNHTGYIYKKGRMIRFIHSFPYFVVNSYKASTDTFLVHSRYRVTGRLFNDTMIQKWLTGEKITLKKDYFQN